MRKIYIIIISLLFLLVTNQNILAIAAPVTTADWTTDFQSSGAIDTARRCCHGARL